jgi:hypothetical protein
MLVFDAGGRAGVLELASLCSTSKHMRSNCLELLHGQSMEQTAAVVVAGLEEAVSATADLQQKSTQAIWWLLGTALAPGTAGALLQLPSLITTLLHIPNFPLQLAQGLCQRGLCMPYASIAAAGCGSSRVAGAWTRASLRASIVLPLHNKHVGLRHPMLAGNTCCDCGLFKFLFSTV